MCEHLLVRLPLIEVFNQSNLFLLRDCCVVAGQFILLCRLKSKLFPAIPTAIIFAYKIKRCKVHYTVGQNEIFMSYTCLD